MTTINYYLPVIIINLFVTFHEIAMYSLNMNKKKINMCILVLKVVFIIITYVYVHVCVHVVVGML